MHIPTLTTDRLLLRPFREDDLAAIERHLATPHIAATTLSFSYPSPPGAAQAWLRRRLEWQQQGTSTHWAITLPGDELVGAVGIALTKDVSGTELGYWIGPDYWNNGYATEATRAVIAYGFGTLGLPRIHASCFVGNDASARVLQKAGMTEEGILREHLLKDGVPRDVRLFAIRRDPDRR